MSPWLVAVSRAAVPAGSLLLWASFALAPRSFSAGPWRFACGVSAGELDGCRGPATARRAGDTGVAFTRDRAVEAGVSIENRTTATASGVLGHARSHSLDYVETAATASGVSRHACARSTPVASASTRSGVSINQKKNGKKR